MPLGHGVLVVASEEASLRAYLFLYRPPPPELEVTTYRDTEYELGWAATTAATSSAIAAWGLVARWFSSPVQA